MLLFFTFSRGDVCVCRIFNDVTPSTEVMQCKMRHERIINNGDTF